MLVCTNRRDAYSTEEGNPTKTDCNRLNGHGLFVLIDLVDLLEREGDVVQAVKQAMAAERFDVELEAKPGFVGNRLRFQIDGESIRRRVGVTLEKFFDLGFAQRDRKRSILEAVAEENIGERRAITQRMP